MTGPIEKFFTDDHARLAGLLNQAVPSTGAIDGEAYAQFREGLLRHIGMEEKILLPEAKAARGGDPLPVARALREDHGVITSLLVPSPSVHTADLLRRILTRHNRLEEGPDALYATCDQILGSKATALLERCRAAPPVKMMKYNDGARALEILERIAVEESARVVD